MPLARIEIEQITGSGWVARVEAQDFNMNARGLNLRADSFDEIMILVEDGYREIVPLEAPPKKPTVTEPQAPPKIIAGPAVVPLEAPARDVKQYLPPRESTESARAQPPVRITPKGNSDHSPNREPEPWPPRDDRNPYVPPHGPSRR